MWVSENQLYWTFWYRKKMFEHFNKLLLILSGWKAVSPVWTDDAGHRDRGGCSHGPARQTLHPLLHGLLRYSRHVRISGLLRKMRENQGRALFLLAPYRGRSSKCSAFIQPSRETHPRYSCASFLGVCDHCAALIMFWTKYMAFRPPLTRSVPRSPA